MTLIERIYTDFFISDYLLNLCHQRSNQNSVQKMQSKAKNAEILAIRQKYPELRLLDDMLKGITVNESDEELLDEYYTQRAKDELLFETK